jgi:hypothetical protein
MIDTNSTGFLIGKKIRHALAVYVVIKIVIKGSKLIIKSLRGLLISSVVPGGNLL